MRRPSPLLGRLDKLISSLKRHEDRYNDGSFDRWHQIDLDGAIEKAKSNGVDDVRERVMTAIGDVDLENPEVRIRMEALMDRIKTNKQERDIRTAKARHEQENQEWHARIQRYQEFIKFVGRGKRSKQIEVHHVKGGLPIALSKRNAAWLVRMYPNQIYSTPDYFTRHRTPVAPVTLRGHVSELRGCAWSSIDQSKMIQGSDNRYRLALYGENGEILAPEFAGSFEQFLYIVSKKPVPRKKTRKK